MGKSRFALLFVAMSFLGAAVGAAETADAIKALFKQYSPDAYYLADAYSKKAKEYGLKDIAAFMDASSEDSRWRSYARIVHECAIATMDYYRDDSGTMVVLSRDRNYQVPWTSVFYSVIVAKEIPERLRMAHYSLLVDQPDDLPLGHWAGVYGLVGEMAAHYLAMKATWELLPLLKAQGAKAPWGSFFQAVNESMASALEFKYYAMRYILYEERDSPEKYRGIMENTVFAKAFIDLNGTCDAFIARYFAAKDDLYESIRSAGLAVAEQGSALVIGPKGAEARKELSSATYAALANELSKPAYRDLLSKLNGGLAVAGTPPFPGMELVATGSALPIEAVLSEAEALKLGGLNIGVGKREAVIATQQLRAQRMGLGPKQSETPATSSPATASSPAAA
ncbi:MAG: hypothetical protein Q8M76_18260, partial [Spirochaetaceae bacterium]|nr:hypothetical protein [Spirochaetaceae bacterium]